MTPVLQMGGCAGLHHYMFGVGAYIQEMYVLDNTVNVQPISGSNFVGAAMLSDRSVESIWKLWSARLDDLVQRRPWTGLYHLGTIMEHHTRDVVRQASPSVERMQQHYIRVSVLDRMKTRWYHLHIAHADYVSAMCAGAFIPVLLGGLWTWHRNKRCIDGGVRLPWTTASKPRGGKNSTLSISITDSKTFSTFHLLWMAFYGIWSRAAHHRSQFAHGYAHAQSVLKPALDALLVRRPTRLVLPDVTGHVRWDSEQRAFVA